MKDFLSEAHASVDWPVSQFPAFETRLKAWLDQNIEVLIEETPGEHSWNVIITREKAELPLAFSVEAGSYINCIRSALDIIACGIGKEEMVLYPDHIYFPVADSADDFARGNYRGVKFVRQLSGTRRKVIEEREPYKGGNGFLWACHKLDIVRKHKRLLQTRIALASSLFIG